VVGTRSTMAQVPHLADGGLLLDLLHALAVCHDVYVEYRRNYFAHTESQIGNYAIGRFDIYEVLNKIIETVHARVSADATERRPAYRLVGSRQLMLVPLIGAVYPRAEFVHLRQGTVSSKKEGRILGLARRLGLRT